MEQIQITAEDLFFLAKVMKARFLDYDYVRMLSELTARYSLKESIAVDNLNDKGLIYEDFSGEIEVEDLAKQLFDPIFFGEFESELIVEDHVSLNKYKYHVLDGRYIEVKVNDHNLTIREVDKEDILDNLPYVDELSSKEVFNLDYFENKDVDGIMILKRQKVNGQSKCIQLVNDDGVFYQSKGLKIHSLNKEELKQLVRKIIWEE